MKHYLILILTLLLIPQKGLSQVFLPTACDWVREEKEDSVYIFIKDCCTVYNFWWDEKPDSLCDDSFDANKKESGNQTSYKYHKKNLKGIYLYKAKDEDFLSIYCETKTGQPHGKCIIRYFLSEKIFIKQRYRHGRKHGKFILYDPEGHIEVKRYYTNGLLNGYDYAYSYKEKMMSKQFYIMGKAITEVKVKPYKIK